MVTNCKLATNQGTFVRLHKFRKLDDDLGKRMLLMNVMGRLLKLDISSMFK